MEPMPSPSPFRRTAVWIGLASSLAAGLWIALGPADAVGNSERGKALYEKNCQGCHGKTGTGLGGATPSLADAERMRKTSDAELFEIVSNGRPGTGMPAWAKVLNEQDRWNVVRYVRTLAH